MLMKDARRRDAQWRDAQRGKHAIEAGLAGPLKKGFGGMLDAGMLGGCALKKGDARGKRAQKRKRSVATRAIGAQSVSKTQKIGTLVGGEMGKHSKCALDGGTLDGKERSTEARSKTGEQAMEALENIRWEGLDGNRQSYGVSFFFIFWAG